MTDSSTEYCEDCNIELEEGEEFICQDCLDEAWMSDNWESDEDE